MSKMQDFYFSVSLLDPVICRIINKHFKDKFKLRRLFILLFEELEQNIFNFELVIKKIEEDINKTSFQELNITFLDVQEKKDFLYLFGKIANEIYIIYLDMKNQNITHDSDGSFNLIVYDVNSFSVVFKFVL